ncbi:MAG: hypothetical protein JNL74_11130 [Fibrobacteres bacterium]|nr:hypothetical protein [Fibrobacterota bacterium]
MSRIAILFISLVTAGITVAYPVADTDLFWHLASGEWMVRAHALLASDPFSISAYGHEWINVHWLYQLIMLFVYSTAGFAGIVFLKSIITATTAYLLLSIRPADMRSMLIRGAVIVSALFFIRHQLADRPTLFTLLFIALFINFFERYRTDGSAKWLIALIPVEILWANIQGLFLLGPAIAFCYFLGESLTAFISRRKPMLFRLEPTGNSCNSIRHTAVLTLLLCIVPVINPNGMDVYSLALRLFERILPFTANAFSMNVAENVPPSLLSSNGSNELLFYKVFGLLTLLSFIPTRQNLSAGRIILFTLFLFLSAIAFRNIQLYIIVCTAIIFTNIDDAADHFRIRASLSVILFTLTISSVLIYRATENVERDPANFTAPRTFPFGAADYIASCNVPGNLFNSVQDGGFIAWRLYPAQRSFVDGRLILRSSQFFNTYLTILDTPVLFNEYSRNFGITKVLLPTNPDTRYYKLVKAMNADTAWKTTYKDNSHIVYTRKNLSDSLLTKRIHEENLRTLKNEYVRRNECLKLSSW